MLWRHTCGVFCSGRQQLCANPADRERVQHTRRTRAITPSSAERTPAVRDESPAALMRRLAVLRLADPAAYDAVVLLICRFGEKLSHSS